MTSIRLTRIASPCAFALLITLASRVASAQVDAGAVDGGTPDGAAATPALSSTDFTLSIEHYDPLQGSWIPLTPADQTFFFDRARCECGQDTNNFTGSVKIAIAASATAVQKIQVLLAANLMASGDARLYAGGSAVNCLIPSSIVSTDALSSYCLNLLDPSSYTASIPGGMTVFLTQRKWESPPIPVAWLFNATQAPVCNSLQSCNQSNACGSTLAETTIFFWAQTSQGTAPDRSDLSFPLQLRGQVAYAPADVTVEAANEAIVVQWGWQLGINPAADASFLGVQLFCQRGQSDQVFVSGTYAPAFTTSALLCPNAAPVPASPLAFADFDPRYLCSGLLSPTTTSYRIPGLQNGVRYGVGVAAVDKYGNLNPAGVVYQVPNGSDASLDASAGAVDGGVGGAGGGGCALAGGPSPRDAWMGLGLLVLGALWFGRTRRGSRQSSGPRRC